MTPGDLGGKIRGQIWNQRVLISRYRNYQKKIVTLKGIRINQRIPTPSVIATFVKKPVSARLVCISESFANETTVCVFDVQAIQMGLLEAGKFDLRASAARKSVLVSV